MKKMVLLVLAGLLVGSTAYATVVADYAFTGGSATSSDADTDTTASIYTIIDAAFTNNQMEMTAGTPGTGGWGDSLNGAFSSAEYNAFNISVEAGGSLDLQTLTFDYSVTGVYQGFDAYVLIDQAGDGFSQGDLFATITLEGPFNSNPSTNAVIDLSTLATIAGGSSLKFRIYFSDNSTANTRIHHVDNVILSGDVTPPPTIVASYEFTGGAATSSDGESNTTASTYTIIDAAFTNNQMEMTAGSPGTGGWGDSWNGAFSSAEYNAFSIGVNSGITLDLQLLTFTYAVTNVYQGFDAYVVIDQSGDGFTSGDLFTTITLEGSFGDDLSTNAIIDISTLDAIIDGSSLSFRIYFSDNSQNNSFYHVLDDVVLRGDLTIPPNGTIIVLR